MRIMDQILQNKIKVILIIIVIITAIYLSFSSFSDKPKASFTNKKYYIEANKSYKINNKVFFEETVISIDPKAYSEEKAKITFCNCNFIGNITIISDVGGAIQFDEKCTFDKNTNIVVRETSEHNATGKWAGSDQHTCIYLDNQSLTDVSIMSYSATAVIAVCDFTFNTEHFKIPKGKGFQEVVHEYDTNGNEDLYIKKY